MQCPGKALQYATFLHPAVPVLAPMLPSFTGCCFRMRVNKEENASSTSLQSNVCVQNVGKQGRECKFYLTPKQCLCFFYYFFYWNGTYNLIEIMFYYVLLLFHLINYVFLFSLFFIYITTILGLLVMLSIPCTKMSCISSCGGRRYFLFFFKCVFSKDYVYISLLSL